jgi:hypothetical protein
MAITLSLPIVPGSFWLWNLEYAAHPSLQHTAARVLVTGIDARDPEEPWVCYVVDGDPPVLTCCRAAHFRASVTPDRVGGWAASDEVAGAVDVTRESIATSQTTGLYSFMAHPLHQAAVAAQQEA